MRLYGQSPEQAIGVGTQVHTSPQAFGKVMSTIKPRHAVGYHFFNEQATHDDILRGVLETYDGGREIQEGEWSPIALGSIALHQNSGSSDCRIEGVAELEPIRGQAAGRLRTRGPDFLVFAPTFLRECALEQALDECGAQP